MDADTEPVTTDREQLLQRFERATELPLLLLALMMVPLLIVPLIVHLPDRLEASLLSVDWIIWSAFAVEYVVRLSLTKKRLSFVRREWPDLLILTLPFLRPLRVVRSARALRLLRLGRLASFLAEATQEARRLLKRHSLHYALVITGVVILASAGLAYALEENSGGSIDSYGDALWWAVTTITTVGYGDMFPVTSAGRGVAAFLMLAGIALFGVLTANLAAFLIEETPNENDEDPVLARLDEIAARLARLETLLDEAQP